MCSNQSPAPSPTMAPSTPIVPYPLPGMKPFEGNSSQVLPTLPTSSGLLPIDQYRLQLYNYAMVERLRFSNFGNYNNQLPFCPGYPYNPRLALQMSLFHNRVFTPEEPKPQHSYIGLIAMAILSSPETKLVLSDIYQYILDNYPYFRTRGPGWRNSIRHNLSLNDCFIKAGRSANGKGHYWAIHPANVEDFKKGDFRRRKAQRKVRKHMGLAVDEEGDDSPSPPPVPLSPPPPRLPIAGLCPWPTLTTNLGLTNTSLFPPIPNLTRKRQFDVASLLAPDEEKDSKTRRYDESYLSSSDEVDAEEDIDVVSEDSKEKVSETKQEKKDGDEEVQRIYVRDLSSGREETPSPQIRHVENQRNSSPTVEDRSGIPIWVRQPNLMHPTAVFPPVSFMEQHHIVNRLYEQRIAQHHHRRLLQQQQQHQSTEREPSPVNLKHDGS